jgi:hypothetical protein
MNVMRDPAYVDESARRAEPVEQCGTDPDLPASQSPEAVRSKCFSEKIAGDAIVVRAGKQR